MKKTLVAIAALAAATGAMAQSSVTLYGALDVGVGSIASQTNGVKVATRSGAETSANDSSRWGLTGTEDLGGGMKAEFKIESGLGTNPRSGITSTSLGGNASASAKDNLMSNGTPTGNAFTLDATVMGDRELWIGVTNGGLRVNAGYGVTAMRNLAVQTDAAQSNQVGNVIAHEVGNFRREGVRVDYTAVPGWLFSGGVSGNRQNSAGQAGDIATAYVPAGEIRTGKGWTLGGQYTQGPINAGYFHDEASTQGVGASIATTTGNVGLPFLLASDTAFANKTFKTDLLAGSYNAGVATLYGQYYTQKVVINETSGTSATTGGAAGADTSKGAGKISGTSFGVRVPFGAATVYAQALNLKDQLNSADNVSQDRKFTGYSVGARYDMSKRTYAYVNTGAIKKAEYAAEAAAGTITHKYELRQTAAGIVHAF